MTRILIVEDNSTLVRALARTFSKQAPELSVVTSSDGLEATELLGKQEFDFVITDLQMPRMDGFELLAWVLTHRPALPVFAVTGYANESTHTRLNALGAIECFTKPLDVRAIISRLRETLSQSIRGHVENVSLASFLQLIEMERKTCTLTVESNGSNGTLFVRRGQLLDARTGSLSGEDAAISIVAWPDPGITIVSHCAVHERVISAPLGFILMEAMRVQDEAAHRNHSTSDWPEPIGTLRPSDHAALAQVRNSKPAATCSSSAPGLPSGARALAVVETATGELRSWTAREGAPLRDWAELCAVVLRHEVAALTACGLSEEAEELVLTTKSECLVIRPIDAAAERFAMLVFAREDTSLVMARIQLDRFLASMAP